MAKFSWVLDGYTQALQESASGGSDNLAAKLRSFWLNGSLYWQNARMRVGTQTEGLKLRDFNDQFESVEAF